MGRLLKDQTLYTSGVDAHGDVNTPDLVRILFSQLSDPMLLSQDHDMSLPPIAVARNKRLLNKTDGGLAIIADVEIFDEEAAKRYGGFSPAFTTGRALNADEVEIPDVQILYDPLQFSDEEISELIESAGPNAHFEGRERKLKAAHPQAILIVNYVSLVVLNAMLGEAAKGTFKLVFPKLRDLLRRKRGMGIDAKAQLHLRAGGPHGDFMVIIDLAPDQIEWLGREAHTLESALAYVRSVVGRLRIERVAIRPTSAPPYWDLVHFVEDNGLVHVLSGE